MTIRLRLTLWYTGILAATLIGLGVALYTFISMTLYGNIRADLDRMSKEVYEKARVVPYMTSQGVGWAISLPSLDTFQSHVFLQAVDQTGEVKSKSGNLGKYSLPLSDKTFEKVSVRKVPVYETVQLGGVTLYVQNSPLLVKGGESAGVLQVATSINPIQTSLNTFKIIFFAASFLLVGLAFSFGWFLARKALMPIEHVIGATEQIQSGMDLDKRIVYDGPKDEIGRLTETINGMLSRIQGMYTNLEEAYRTQRRFVSDASHELRTPLTTIRGNVDLLEKVWKQQQALAEAAEAAADAAEAAGAPERTMAAREQVSLTLEAMHDIAAEAERMSRLVNDLLSLARADAGQSMLKEPIELKPLVEEVTRRAQHLPREAEWIVGDLSPLEDVWVHGSRDYMQQLLFIFIDNAFKYTPAGQVRLDARLDGGQVGLQISDTGIGMDKDEVPHIFERFYRADVSRGRTAGTGLGLSIAKWIIDEHHGSIEVLTQKGSGTTFVLWFPRSFSAERKVRYTEERPSDSDVGQLWKESGEDGHERH